MRLPMSETVWPVANFGNQGLKIFIPFADFDSREHKDSQAALAAMYSLMFSRCSDKNTVDGSCVNGMIKQDPETLCGSHRDL